MSIDSIRNKIQSIQRQIAQLQGDKGRESEKVASYMKKAASSAADAARTSNPSTSASKMRDHVRYQEDAAKAQKRVSEIEEKIAYEQRKMADATKELAKEEDREFEKRNREEKRRVQEHSARMKSVTSQLNEHSTLHRETMSEIERLSRLPERITVLFLAANPIDQQPLRLDEEARAVAEMIRKSAHRDAVRLESCWAVRPLDVLQAINEHSPRIFHFSGHGSDQDEIVFQDQFGNSKLVSKEAIVQTMIAGSVDIQLVFFNTCFSHRQAEAVVQHVPAAIGMKVAIGDEAARVFAAQFYSAVGFGKSVKQAFGQAKAALLLEGISEVDTPVLHIAVGVDAEELILVRPHSNG